MAPSVLPVLERILAGVVAAKCETEVLDFKQAKGTLKEAAQDLAEAAVCFANANGGVIIVGVSDDKSGLDAFVGCDLDAAVMRGRIHQLTSPPLLVEVEAVQFADKRLLMISVPEGIEVYSTTKGYSYHRINTDCVPMRPLDVTRLTEERRGVDWSATSNGRPVEDVDQVALYQCRRLLADSYDSARQAYGKLSDADLLKALKAVADDGALTRAGELMLCHDVPYAPVEAVVYQHRRTLSGEPDSILRLRTPLVTAVEELLRAIKLRQNITPVTLSDGQQWQIEDYPSIAVREAIVNAFIHGDWRLRTPIQVEHSPQYLQVNSPGPLVSGVTTQNILTKGSRARYPALAAAFRLLGLAEEVGQGVDRMYREMIRSGRDVPVISEDAEQVSVRFRGQPPNTRIAKFLAALPDVEQGDTDAMLIIHTLCRKRTVKASTVAGVIQRTEDEAQAALMRLATAPLEILEPTRTTARNTRPTYRLRAAVLACLGNAVSYHSPTASEVDRKIVDHLADYGTINNRTIQRLFDVDVYQARDLLRELVSRQVIERVSEQKRGTAVRYGPGPRFPRPRARRARS